MDKRHSPRVSIDPLEIVIEEIKSDSGTYINATLFIEEVSRAGMRFTSNIEFSKDEIIRFHFPSLDVENLMSARIAWKTEVAAGQFKYGSHIQSEQN